MTPRRWLALAPSAAGALLCLIALTSGSTLPAVAAQDVYSQQAAHFALMGGTQDSNANAAMMHAKLVRRIARMELRAHRIAAAKRRARIRAREAAKAAAQQQAVQGTLPVASSQPVASGGVMVLPGGFEQCVIQAESGGNPQAYNTSSGASGLFGFLPSTWANTPEGASYPGGAYTAPASVQEQAFLWLFDKAGVAPWRPYDGC